MKSIYKLSAYLFSLSALFGCSDFVNIDSPSLVRQDQFFASQSDVTAAVTGLYSGLRSYYGGFYEVAELPSDNTGINGYTLASAPMDQLNWLPSTGAIGTRWTVSYNVIARANAILERIDGIAMPSDLRNQYIGEARFMRALMYFNLVQFFGDVPLIVREIKTEQEAYTYNREKVAKVYAQIEEDLNAASSLLPAQYSGANVGRVTSGAVGALLGKVYVTNKQYDKAVQVLEKVVQSGSYLLLQNYADVFSVVNKNNREIIFDVQYFGGAGFGEGSNFSISFAPFGSGTSITSGGTPGSSNIGTRDLFEAFSVDDKRRDVSLRLYPSPDSLYYTSKFLDKPIAANEGKNHWPVLRYSDVLLLLAEAQNENGNATEAARFLNMVRDRAGLGKLEGLSKEAFRSVVLKERRLELCFEGSRWFDLIRTGTMLEVMTAYKQKYLKYGGYLVDNYVVTANKVLFPIPFREISLNPDLGQNPGYQ